MPWSKESKVWVLWAWGLYPDPGCLGSLLQKFIWGNFSEVLIIFLLVILGTEKKKAHIIKTKCNTWAAKLAWRVRCHGMKPARKESLGINIWTGVRKHSWVKKTKTKSGESLCLRLTFKSTFYKGIVANSSILQTVLMFVCGGSRRSVYCGTLAINSVTMWGLKSWHFQTSLALSKSAHKLLLPVRVTSLLSTSRSWWDVGCRLQGKWGRPPCKIQNTHLYLY